MEGHIFYIATYTESMYSGNSSKISFFGNCQEFLDTLSDYVGELNVLLRENLRKDVMDYEEEQPHSLDTNFLYEYTKRPHEEIIQDLLDDVIFFADLRIDYGETTAINIRAGIAKPGESIDLYL